MSMLDELSLKLGQAVLTDEINEVARSVRGLSSFPRECLIPVADAPEADRPVVAAIHRVMDAAKALHDEIIALAALNKKRAPEPPKCECDVCKKRRETMS